MATATKKRAPKTTAATLPASITLPELKAGEKWRGIALNAEGLPSHHVILLPGRLKSKTHQESLDWAKERGGHLPDRIDGALLYANNADEAIEEKEWHWLEPLPAGHPDSAWVQGFDDGNQNWSHRSYHCPAVAVRRVPIQ